MAIYREIKPLESLLWCVGGLAFAIAVPIMLISSNVRLIIKSDFLYEWDFNRYEIELRTGLSREELRSVTRQIRDYFSNEEKFLNVRVDIGEGQKSLFNEREIFHMRDVKGLMNGVFSLQMWSALYILIFVTVGLSLRRKSLLRFLNRCIAYSGVGSLFAIVVVAGVSIINFDAMFTRFHLISFANDLWLLDPYSDYLLMMFPEGFFLDATLAIALLTLVEFAALTGLCWWLVRLVSLPVNQLSSHNCTTSGSSRRSEIV